MGPTFSIPYKSLAGGPARPYLVMVVTGINGQSGPVLGIVDSGADTSSFPYEYATLLGYTGATLKDEDFIQAGGVGKAYRATQTSTAVVQGLEGGPSVLMTPSFIRGGQWVLWGRTDFMRVFNVGFFESQQVFTITAAD